MQQDEFKPRQLEAFTGRNATCPDTVSAPPALYDNGAAVLSSQLFLKPHLWGVISPFALCVTCLLSQYCPWHTHEHIRLRAGGH